MTTVDTLQTFCIFSQYIVLLLIIFTLATEQ